MSSFSKKMDYRIMVYILQTRIMVDILQTSYLWYQCLRSVITIIVKALESLISCDIVGQNLNVLYDAEKNFIKTKSSERIMWASRHNVRTYCEENYQNGDKMFYKKRAVKGWEIPTTLLRNEGNFVLIRHVSTFYRCHPCHLMKTEISNNSWCQPSQWNK